MDILRIAKEITEINESLEELRSSCSEMSNPEDVFTAYSYGFLYRRNLLLKELAEYASTESYYSDVDVWVGINGPSINHGSGDLLVLANFLKDLRMATAQAVTIAQFGNHRYGRFNALTEAASAYQISATAPGSFKFGLSMPKAVRLSESQIKSLNHIDLFTTQKSKTEVFDKALEESLVIRKYGVDALKLVVSLLSPQSKGFYNFRARFGDQNLLKMLYYVRRIFSKGIDSFYFEGDMFNGRVLVDETSKEQIIRIASDLMSHGTYVEGISYVAEADTNPIKGRFENVEYRESKSSDRRLIDKVSFSPAKGVELDMPGLLQKHVWFTGMLEFDAKSNISNILISEMNVLHQQDHHDFAEFR